jgi:predicted DNA-binding ribbon-helix-helix protein
MAASTCIDRACGVEGQGFMTGPVKRSVTIAGHETSITLEPIFWNALRDAAEAERLPINALIARIDADRIKSPQPPNLGSALRVWLFERARADRL